MTKPPVVALADERDRMRHWRGNLFGAASAVFTVTIGGFTAQPLVPVFLHRELGIEDPGRLAFWAGVAAAASPLSAVAFSPLWGMVADRVGRRDMLTRAVAGAALFTAALGVTQSPLQIAVVRGLNGAVSGVYAGALALVAAETPRAHLARALGTMTTVRSLGQSLGPAIGGIVGTVLPLRVAFLGAGLVMLAGIAPILLRIKETTRPPKGAPRPTVRAALSSAGAGASGAVMTIIAAQALAQFTLSGAQQLILVRIIGLDPGVATVAGGAAFAAISFAAALAGTASPSGLARSGYRPTVVAAALVLALGVVAAALAGSVAWLLAAAAALGAGYGTLNTAAASMLALETPAGVKATVFGLSSSAQWIGIAAGALLGGTIAAATGPATALGALSVAAIAAATIVALAGREPRGASGVA